MSGYTPKFTPNYVNPPTRGHEATDAALVSLIFAAIAVVLRLFTKFYVTNSPGWDDGIIADSIAETLLMNHKFARSLPYASAL